MPLTYGDTARWGLENLFVPAQRGGVVFGTMTGAVVLTLQQLSSSTGISWSGTPPKSANHIELTATGNVTSFQFFNGKVGAVYNCIFDFAGFTAPASVSNFSGGSAGLGTFTTTSGAKNLLSGVWINAGTLRGAMNPG